MALLKTNIYRVVPTGARHHVQGAGVELKRTRPKHGLNLHRTSHSICDKVAHSDTQRRLFKNTLDAPNCIKRILCILNAALRAQRVYYIPRLSGSSVAFLGKGNVANPFVVRVDLKIPTVGDVVEVLDVLNTKQMVWAST